MLSFLFPDDGAEAHKGVIAQMIGDREYVQNSDIVLKNDKIEASFVIGDTVFFYDYEYEHFYHFDNHCPINRQELFLFDLPERINREQKGVFRINFNQVDYLKDAPNVRVVLSYTRGAF